VTVSNLRLTNCSATSKHLRQRRHSTTDVLQAIRRACASTPSFSFRCCHRAKAASPSTIAPNFWRKMATNISGLQNALLHLYTELQAIPKKPDEVHAMARRVDELKTQFGFILEAQDRNTVFWIDRRGDRRGGQHNVFLQATPITLSQILAECVVRASGVGGTHFGNAGRSRGVRVHPQPAGHPARARTGRALALRL
jgi:hypothetical protein